jgi:hypothetical protein
VPRNYLDPERIERFVAYRNMSEQQRRDKYVKPRDFTPQDWLDLIAISTSPLPGLGDATDFVSQLNRYMDDPSPENRKWLQASALIPVVPMSGILIGVQGFRSLAFASPDAVRSIGSAAERDALWKATRDREKVYQATGWWRGKDNKWRVDLSDAQSKINWDRISDLPRLEPRNTGRPIDDVLNWAEEDIRVAKLEDILDHPRLYEAYPELKDYIVHIDVYEPKATLGEQYAQGQQDPRKRIITVTGTQGEKLHSTVLHEVQHVIQDLENFPRGSSPSQVNISQLKNVYGEVKKDLWEHNTIELYARILGDQFDRALGKPAAASKIAGALDIPVENIPDSILARAIGRTHMPPGERAALSIEASIKQDRMAYYIELLDEYGHMKESDLTNDVANLSNWLTNEFRNEYLTTMGEIEARNVQYRFLASIAGKSEEVAALSPGMTESMMLHNEGLYNRPQSFVSRAPIRTRDEFGRTQVHAVTDDPIQITSNQYWQRLVRESDEP